MHVNNDVKYLITSKVQKAFGKDKKKIQVNQDSISFDLVLGDSCPDMNKIQSVKIFAVLKNERILKQVVHFDLKSLKLLKKLKYLF